MWRSRYDDPEGVTYKTLHALMGEMAALFSDEVFNIGSDETSAKGRCSVNTSFAIERRLLQAIQHEFKKVPEGWEVSSCGGRRDLSQNGSASAI